MGSDLVSEFPVARQVYERCSAVLGYDLARLSFEDPDDQLRFTRYTQPALLAHEIACLEAFRSLADGIEAEVFAGHSLGEYTALVAAGAISLEHGIALVAERGRLMSELGRGSMVATTLDFETARVLADKHYCGIGGANLPDQTVVSGADEDLNDLIQDLEENYPKKRAIELKTEGAFHTYHMVRAAEQFRPVLEKCEFRSLGSTVLSNYTGFPHTDDPETIRARLFFQLFNPVRWIACMEWVAREGVDTIVEFGGGIGRGETPAEKRPNLESVAKKSMNWLKHQADYLPAIDAVSIRAAIESLINQ